MDIIKKIFNCNTVNSVIGKGVNEIKNPKTITAEGILNINDLNVEIPEENLGKKIMEK
ncbi:MAG: hypothetical protein IPF63_06155 [Bacteroidetes bacterium]|nr:hypothetical protein [Bacteroidota bacterium]